MFKSLNKWSKTFTVIYLRWKLSHREGLSSFTHSRLFIAGFRSVDMLMNRWYSLKFKPNSIKQDDLCHVCGAWVFNLYSLVVTKGLARLASPAELNFVKKKRNAAHYVIFPRAWGQKQMAVSSQFSIFSVSYTVIFLFKYWLFLPARKLPDESMNACEVSVRCKTLPQFPSRGDTRVLTTAQLISLVVWLQSIKIISNKGGFERTIGNAGPKKEMCQVLSSPQHAFFKCKRKWT